MSNLLHQNLLGYLLGAIDPEERAALEEQLRHDESLRRDLDLLRGAVGLLAGVENHANPPPGLAQRCCEYVYSRTEIVPAALSPIGGSAAVSPPARRWSWLDLSVAGAIAVAVAVLILPGIFQSNVQSKLIACQNNLKDIGFALNDYADRNSGYYPAANKEDGFNVAGMWAPTLMSQGYLKPDQTMICPSSELAANSQFRVPTLPQLKAMSGLERAEAFRRLTGYGNTLGYRDGDNGPYHAPRNEHRDNFALIADPPSPGLANSVNHNGTGPNVLFEGGSVKHLNGTHAGDDDIYKNGRNQVAEGIGSHDAVIVHPDHTPAVGQ